MCYDLRRIIRGASRSGLLGFFWSGFVVPTHSRWNPMQKQHRVDSTEITPAYRQLRWIGHAIRVTAHRLPRCLLYGELLRGPWSRGGKKNQPPRQSHARKCLGYCEFSYRNRRCCKVCCKVILELETHFWSDLLSHNECDVKLWFILPQQTKECQHFFSGNVTPVYTGIRPLLS